MILILNFFVFCKSKQNVEMKEFCMISELILGIVCLLLQSVLYAVHPSRRHSVLKLTKHCLA